LVRCEMNSPAFSRESPCSRLEKLEREESSCHRAPTVVRFHLVSPMRYLYWEAERSARMRHRLSLGKEGVLQVVVSVGSPRKLLRLRQPEMSA
jgi:hypothetical protein